VASIAAATSRKREDSIQFTPVAQEEMKTVTPTRLTQGCNHKEGGLNLQM